MYRLVEHYSQTAAGCRGPRREGGEICHTYSLQIVATLPGVQSHRHTGSFYQLPFHLDPFQIVNITQFILAVFPKMLMDSFTDSLYEFRADHSRVCGPMGVQYLPDRWLMCNRLNTLLHWHVTRCRLCAHTERVTLEHPALIYMYYIHIIMHSVPYYLCSICHCSSVYMFSEMQSIMF